MLSGVGFLSCLEMRLSGTEPVFLSRTLRDSHFAQVEMTNKEFESFGKTVPLQSIHIRLLRTVHDGFYQRVRIINFNQYPVRINISFKLGADFADIFEVRGTTRPSRGTPGKPVIKRKSVLFNYLGTDKIRRATKISFYPVQAAVRELDSFVHVDFFLGLEPKKKVENIRAGNGTAALEFTRRQDKTYCGVIGTQGDVTVIFR